MEWIKKHWLKVLFGLAVVAAVWYPGRDSYWIHRTGGLIDWHRTEPDRMRDRFHDLEVELRRVCGWAAANAPAEFKCSPGFTNPPSDPAEVPKSGPEYP